MSYIIMNLEVIPISLCACLDIQNAKLDIFDVLYNNDSGGDSSISLRLP